MNDLIPTQASGEALAALAGVAARLPARKNEEMVRQATELGRNLGKDAYYSFPAGGGTVEGLSVHAADELAKIMGGIAIQCPSYDLDRENNTLSIVVTAIDMKNLVIQQRPHFFTLAPPPQKFAAKPDQVARWESMQCQAAASKAIRTTFLHVAGRQLVRAVFDAAKAAETEQTRKDLEKKGPRDPRKVTFDALLAYVDADEILDRLGAWDTWTAEKLTEARAWGRGLKEEAAKPRDEERTEPKTESKTEKPDEDPDPL